MGVDWVRSGVDGIALRYWLFCSDNGSAS
jgi:hypothetical protein